MIQITEIEAALLSEFAGTTIGTAIDWNTLMPVFEKIVTLKEYYFKGTIHGETTSFGKGIYVSFFGVSWRIFYYITYDEFNAYEEKDAPHEIEPTHVRCKNLKEAYYKAILQFIQWFNTQNTTK